MLAVSTYGIVLTLHIVAAVAAFGFSLAAPLYVPYVRRANPRALSALHDLQYMMETRVTGPAILLLFLFGVYLASKNDLWDQSWVSVPVTILVVIIGLDVWVIKAIKRLAATAKADDAASADGELVVGAEYEQLYGRYLVAQSMLGALVLIAIFFMTAKPG